jgi:CBS domain-containing protein
MTAVSDVVDFLRQWPPFDELDQAELDQVGALIEFESHPAGEIVLASGDGPLEVLYLVRSGVVEMIHDGRVLDVLGVGELFGQASTLSGLPIGFSVRATEDTELYRMPAAAVAGLLRRPGAVRFLLRSAIVRTALIDPIPRDARRPSAPSPLRQCTADLIRLPLITCDPELPVREVARTMSERNTSAVIVVARGGELGIVTDTDLRTKVIAAGLDSSAPVRAVMSVPVHTIASDRLGGDALIDMVELGVRHLPVLRADGTVIGVLEDYDLVSAQTRTPFVLRRQIARAGTDAEIVAAAAGLRPTMVALRHGGAGAAELSGVWSVVLDALVDAFIRQQLAPGGGRSDHDPAGFSWLALGSVARREAVPSSDIDSGLSWPGDRDDVQLRAYLSDVTGRVGAGLAACGLPLDRHQVSATDPLFARPLSSWQAAAERLVTHPEDEKALLLTSVLLDCRTVWGTETWQSITATLISHGRESGLLHSMLRHAVAHRPPIGILGSFAVEHGGERRGRLDLKSGGVRPIVDIARWAGLAAGVAAASTEERLRAAAAAGTLAADDSSTLLEAFDVVREVRASHQIAQLEAGEAPDDFIAPEWLSSIARAHLKQAFREVAAVQRGMSNELRIGAR